MNDRVKYTETRTFDSDKPMEILGVPGRLKTRSVCSKTTVGCWEHQEWISERRTRKINGETVLMHATIRFDDDCHNNHNTFAITGYGWYDHYKSKDWDLGGCCHEMIAKVFPELEPLIRWHLMDTNGPMHYPGNVTYLAGDRDYNGRAAGEPCSWETRVQLGNWPVTLKLKKEFREWLLAAIEHRRDTPASNPHRKAFKVVPVPYVPRAGTDYNFDPKYSLDDFTNDWYSAPFDTEKEADEFVAALAQVREEVKVIKIVTGYSKGKERELEGARINACWPDITDEQLCLPKAELEALLMARLPSLIEEFRADMKRCGFYWSPEEFDAQQGT